MDATFDQLVARKDYRAALEWLALRHGEALARFCAGTVGQTALAEELVQETFVAALQAMPRYRGGGGPRAWVFGIARLVCRQHLRRTARRSGLLARFWPGEPAPTGVSGHQRAEARLSIEEALARLRPGQREALLLRYQQGMDAREVAQVLGISHAAARKRLSKGLAALRADFEPAVALATADGHASVTARSS